MFQGSVEGAEGEVRRALNVVEGQEERLPRHYVLEREVVDWNSLDCDRGGVVVRMKKYLVMVFEPSVLRKVAEHEIWYRWD